MFLKKKMPDYITDVKPVKYMRYYYLTNKK